MKKISSRSLIYLLLAVIAILPGEVVSACDWCLLSQGLSPLQTMSGSGIRVSQRYTRLEDDLYHGSDREHNPGAEEEYWTTEFAGFYGVTENMTLMVTVPVRKTRIDGHMHRHHDGEMELHSDMKGEESGLGDISVLARYTFFKSHSLDSIFSAAVLAGVKLPTGDTDGRTDDGMEYLDAHGQLGTGSTDYLAGISLNYAAGRASVSANVLGARTGRGETGDEDHRFGNMINYDITGKYRVYPGEAGPGGTQVFLALGVNGEYRERETEEGTEVYDSGGHTVYLSPGIQVVLAPHWVIELSYQHAVYHNLFGTQLGEDFRTVGAITYLF